ncbi:MAG TPA: flagellar hook-basal body complex protein [Nocardioidaceae bacterium]|nr:flagellar hook-basal body complex protein [Nocardioidaceae bacterium]
MLRSMFAAISGLRVNQTMLDVTGNNIANSNTTGFKSSQTIFQDTLSQMLTGGTAPGGNQGGTNPVQIGLGVQLGGTNTTFTQGTAQMTGKPTDVMIQGDGFFVVQRNGEDLYTRAGAFNLDANGDLVTIDGDYVQAVGGGRINIPIGNNDLKSYSIGADGTVTGQFASTGARPLGQLAVADFANPQGLEKVGDTMFRATTSSGAADVGAAGTGRRGQLTAGALEMSNVDLAAEFTNLILAQRGFQANSRVITTSDQVLEDLVNIKR